MDTYRAGLRSAVLLFLSLLPAAGQVNVLTYHNNNSRSGDNTNETVLTLANVNSATFGKLFAYSVDGYVYAQPLYVSGISIPGVGVRNVVFVATQHNSVYAFDADNNTGASSGLIWRSNLGPSAATPSPDFGTRYGSFSSILPEVGITGTPVIDVASATLYVDTFTHEGANYFHKLHALNITNGTERSFSPVVVSATVPGIGVGSVNGVITFQAKQQLQRSALTLAGGIVYAAYAGYDDTDPYHGWIIGFNAANLQQLPNYVFNSTPNSPTNTFGPNAGEGGIWMGGCGLSVDASTNLFFAIGNGSFNALNNSGGTEYGDSFIRLTTSQRLAVADYFTPYNQAFLAANDLDIGSGGVALLPNQAGPLPRLMVGGGKQGRIYLMNRDMMTAGNNHYNSGGSSDAVLQTVALGGAVFATPAYLNGRIYLAAAGDVLAAFSVSNGSLSPQAVSVGPRSFTYPGATPSVSANGTNNGIVWALQMGAPGVLTAYNAANLTTEIYNSTQAAGGRDRLTNGVKFTVPTVAEGKVYVGGQYALSVFGLLTSAIQFSSSAYTVQETAGTATISVNRTGSARGAVQVNYATVSGGTAVNGVNYNSTSGVLSWADGDAAPKIFNVTILDDHQASGNKTVNLALSGVTGASLGARSNAVLTIVQGPYDTWSVTHFGANANNTNIAGIFADPDHDSIFNLLEYAEATDPNVVEPSRRPMGFVLSNHFQLRFTQNLSASNLTYMAQSSSVLPATWTNLATYTAASGWVPNTTGTTVSLSAVTGSPPDQSVTVTVTDPGLVRGPGQGNRFYRIAVHQ